MEQLQKPTPPPGDPRPHTREQSTSTRGTPPASLSLTFWTTVMLEDRPGQSGQGSTRPTCLWQAIHGDQTPRPLPQPPLRPSTALAPLSEAAWCQAPHVPGADLTTSSHPRTPEGTGRYPTPTPAACRPPTPRLSAVRRAGATAHPGRLQTRLLRKSRASSGSPTARWVLAAARLGPCGPTSLHSLSESTCRCRAARRPRLEKAGAPGPRRPRPGPALRSPSSLHCGHRREGKQEALRWVVQFPVPGACRARFAGSTHGALRKTRAWQVGGPMSWRTDKH